MSGPPADILRHGRARVSYPRGTHEADATGEVDWWDRTRAENITITITITRADGSRSSTRRHQPAGEQTQPTGGGPNYQEHGSAERHDRTCKISVSR